MRRTGFSLVFLGLIGGLIFWLTDPQYGPIGRLSKNPGNLLDAAQQSLAGTIVGLAGCAVLTLIGLWLLSRRAS